MKPRLLLLVHLPPPVHGVTAVNEMIVHSAALRAQYDVQVVPLQFAHDVRSLGNRSPAKLWRAVAIAAELVRALRTFRPHAVLISVSPTGAAFVRDSAYVALAKASGARVILHVHAKRLDAPRWLLDRTTRDAYAIYLSQRFERATNLAGEATVANGLPLTPRVTRIAHHPPRILFLSNLLRSKGALALLEALEALHAEGHDFEASFVGAAGDASTELIARLERGPLRSTVRYRGPAYGAAKDELFASHDIFVHPTRHDAFPLVVLEAMRAGLPIVASEEGAIGEIVVDGESGLLAREGKLVAPIARLLADPTLRTRLGDAARARFEARFTEQVFETALCSAVSRFLGESRPRAS